MDTSYLSESSRVGTASSTLSLPPLPLSVANSSFQQMRHKRLPDFAGPNSARLSTSKINWEKPAVSVRGPKSARSVTFTGLDGPTYSLPGSDLKFRLPTSGSIPLTENAVGELDVWPAGNSVKRSSSTPARATAAVPRLLQQLQLYLDQELARVNAPTDRPTEARLQVYREVFEMLIRDFRSYGPLLAAIKAEYEQMLEFSESQLQYMGPLQARLHTFKQEVAQTMRSLEQQHRDVVQDLQKKHNADQTTIRQVTTRNEILELQNEELNDKLRATEKALAEHQESKTYLYRAIKRVQEEKDVRAAQAEEQGAKELKLSRKLQLLQEEIARMHAEVRQRDLQIEQMVPKVKHAELENEFTRTQSHLTAFKKTYHTLMSEHNTVSEQLKSASVARDIAEQELSLLKANSTRRIDWQEAKQHIYTLDVDQTDDNIMQQIYREFDALNDQLEAFRGQSAGGRRSTDYMKDFFDSRGTGLDVPKYLRCSAATVRNRKLSKRDTEIMVKDVWAEKFKYDKSHTGKDNMENYFSIYLQQKFGIQSVMAEWAYSFFDALQRFSHDPDCDLFLKILQGELEEEVYLDQLDILERLRQFLYRAVQRETGREVDVITKEVLYNALKKVFPGKSEEHHTKLRYVLEKDYHGNELKIASLFEEDREGSQCAFMEMLRTQQVEEREEYLRSIEAALKERYTQKDVQSKDDLGKVDMTDVRAAFEKVDHAKPEHDLDIYIARGFGVPVARAKEAMKTSISEFMRRLKRGVVRRSTQKPAVSIKTVIKTTASSIFFSKLTQSSRVVSPGGIETAPAELITQQRARSVTDPSVPFMTPTTPLAGSPVPTGRTSSIPAPPIIVSQGT
eukprot:TRINITY_DN2052_c0_g1_i1.p1 TRINITY_DN2052_c0_g1~~TRINITY_DN2052_c0_g1_i1.p1  ORF type:complete len:849 (-),score=194.54 TRINITY_DN2052_c0_g1_i1:649-3195(-)